ncbi:glycosyltransferase family 9 protein [Terriglobus sp.]|uniref:glycosyltransferase family 9 protein n=1 Tax=Terriglobus sp. TaxID=1889013 RepID=UPI003AFFF7F9
MLLPMIDALRAAHPRAFIECVVQAPIASFLSLTPSLDHVHEFEMDHNQTVNPWVELQRTLKIVRTYWERMRRVRPTACIIPRWGCGFRDLMLAYLLQAPTRIGFASNDFDQSQPPAGYRDALLTCRVRGAQGMAEPARFLFLIEQAGLIPAKNPRAIESVPNASMRHIADTVEWFALATRVGLDPNARLAVIAPGASAPRRMWPVERWASVVNDLHDSGFTVALLTGKQDAEIARQLYELTPLHRRSQTALIAGITNLPESTCLIAHSQLLVGNDSGPGHIAGALDVACVILFIAAQGSDPDGPSAPERVRPMGRRVVYCRPHRTVPPCSGYCTADCAHCILQIQPDAVQHGIRSLMCSDSRNMKARE